MTIEEQNQQIDELIAAGLSHVPVEHRLTLLTASADLACPVNPAYRDLQKWLHHLHKIKVQNLENMPILVEQAA